MILLYTHSITLFINYTFFHFFEQPRPFDPNAVTTNPSIVNESSPQVTDAPMAQVPEGDEENLDRTMNEDGTPVVTRSSREMKVLGPTTILSLKHPSVGTVSILSEGERCIAYMESTVVDISIPPPSFKPVSVSLTRSLRF